jgi:hypothetical protein
LTPLLLALVCAASAQDLGATGRFVPNQDRATIDAELSAAVQRSAASVPVIYRVIARSRLAEVAQACAGYTTALDGDVFTVQCDGRPPFTWTIGTSGRWSDGRETFEVTSKREQSTIRLDLRGQQGGKRYAYTFADGGLEVAHEIYSPQLAESMRWTLTYTKAD